MSLSHDLASEMRQARGRRGMSQQRLAEVSGLSKSGISKIEQAKRWPESHNIAAIEAALGCTFGIHTIYGTETDS